MYRDVRTERAHSAGRGIDRKLREARPTIAAERLQHSRSLATSVCSAFRRVEPGVRFQQARFQEGILPMFGYVLIALIAIPFAWIVLQMFKDDAKNDTTARKKE